MADIKDAPKEASKDKPLRVLRSELKAINLLMQSEGFLLWRQIMEAQEEGRVSLLYQPIADANQVYGQEFVKGEMQGIRASVMMWELLKGTLQAEIEERESSMTEEERKQDEGREE